jgi:glutathione S-transferase
VPVGAWVLLKIYHAKGTRSVRPIWLCHELDLPLEIETIDFSSAYRSTPAWRAISPAGKVPVMIDGDLTMFESGAMVDYLLERYARGRLHPTPGTPESGLYHQWCWFAEATLARPLGMVRLLRGGADDVVADAVGKTRECLAVVDRAVANQPFLLGVEFSAADIMMGYTLFLVERAGLLADYPGAAEYLARLRARPACQRAFDA